MALEVEIMADDNHVFVIQIESVLLVPNIGDKIICGACRKTRKIKKVGVPGRIPEDRDAPDDENQKSMLKE